MTQNNQDQEKALISLGLWRYYIMILYESLLLFAVLFFAGAVALPFLHAENSPIYTLYLVFVSFFYFAWQWRRCGQTLAMSTWKVRLVQDDGTSSQISWLQAAQRFIVASAIFFIFILACYWSFTSEQIIWLASILWVIFFLSAINPWFDKKRRMWQDLASGTRLLKEV